MDPLPPHGRCDSSGYCQSALRAKRFHRANSRHWQAVRGWTTCRCRGQSRPTDSRYRQAHSQPTRSAMDPANPQSAGGHPRGQARLRRCQGLRSRDDRVGGFLAAALTRPQGVRVLQFLRGKPGATKLPRARARARGGRVRPYNAPHKRSRRRYPDGQNAANSDFGRSSDCSADCSSKGKCRSLPRSSRPSWIYQIPRLRRTSTVTP